MNPMKIISLGMVFYNLNKGLADDSKAIVDEGMDVLKVISTALKDKKVTTAITKYHKPISKKTGIKAIEDKLKVTAKKKALPQDPKTTSKVTQELQKKFH